MGLTKGCDRINIIDGRMEGGREGVSCRGRKSKLADVVCMLLEVL